MTFSLTILGVSNDSFVLTLLILAEVDAKVYGVYEIMLRVNGGVTSEVILHA